MTFRLRAASLDELHDRITAQRWAMQALGKVSVSAGRVGGIWTADVYVGAWI